MVGFQSGTSVFLIIPVAGCAIIYSGVQRWPVSDSDYDNSVKGYISNLKRRALNKLGVDESEVSEVPPIILSGYEFDDNVERVKQGDDGRLRSNIYKVVVLFFSRHELHGYTLAFNTLRDARNEGTDVYFYQDIVSVSTLSKTVEAKVDGKKNKGQQYRDIRDNDKRRNIINRQLVRFASWRGIRQRHAGVVTRKEARVKSGHEARRPRPVIF
ncbi:MAG: hypothetical protein IJ520_09265 [Synergistaceae bacterium]|nr:hypothetical protein [Synergistaceae bacterium]